jgi:hypothetical protein
MVWPFKSRRPTEPCPSLGQYKIDTSIETIDVYTFLTEKELAAFGPRVKFEGEELVRVPDALFMELKWDTILGIVNREIYKISIQWAGARAEVGRIERQFKIFCTKNYGKGRNMMVWDASDGNIVIDGHNIGSEAVINIFVTSAKVSNFKQVR